MDPDANLAEILRIIENFRRILDKTSGSMLVKHGDLKIGHGDRIQIVPPWLTVYDVNGEAIYGRNTTKDSEAFEITNDLADDANRLVDLMDGLNQWMSRGGVLPEAWQKDR